MSSVLKVIAVDLIFSRVQIKLLLSRFSYHLSDVATAQQIQSDLAYVCKDIVGDIVPGVVVYL